MNKIVAICGAAALICLGAGTSQAESQRILQGTCDGVGCVVTSPPQHHDTDLPLIYESYNLSSSYRPRRCYIDTRPDFDSVDKIIHEAESFYAGELHCLHKECPADGSYSDFKTRYGAHAELLLERGVPLGACKCDDCKGGDGTLAKYPVIGKESLVRSYDIKGLFANHQPLCPFSSRNARNKDSRLAACNEGGAKLERGFRRTVRLADPPGSPDKYYKPQGYTNFKIEHTPSEGGSSLIEVLCYGADKGQCGCIPSITKYTIATAMAVLGVNDVRLSATPEIPRTRLEIFGPIFVLGARSHDSSSPILPVANYPRDIATPDNRDTAKPLLRVRYLIAPEEDVKNAHLIENIIASHGKDAAASHPPPSLLEEVFSVGNNYIEFQIDTSNLDRLNFLDAYVAKCKSDRDYCIALYNLFIHLNDEFAHFDSQDSAVNPDLMPKKIGPAAVTLPPGVPSNSSTTYDFKFTDSPFYGGPCGELDAHCYLKNRTDNTSGVQGSQVTGTNSAAASTESTGVADNTCASKTKKTPTYSTTTSATARVRVVIRKINPPRSVAGDEASPDNMRSLPEPTDTKTPAPGPPTRHNRRRGTDNTASDNTAGDSTAGDSTASAGTRASTASAEVGDNSKRVIIVTAVATAAISAGFASALIVHRRNRTRMPFNIREVPPHMSH